MILFHPDTFFNLDFAPFPRKFFEIFSSKFLQENNFIILLKMYQVTPPFALFSNHQAESAYT